MRRTIIGSILSVLLVSCQTAPKINISQEAILAAIEDQKRREAEETNQTEEDQEEKVQEEKEKIHIIPVPVQRPFQFMGQPDSKTITELAAITRNANERATVVPHENKYQNARVVYQFVDDIVYPIFCAVMRVTDIELQPGETIQGVPILGDSANWIIGTAQNRRELENVQHVYIKPIREGLETNMIINTDRRTYRLTLASFQITYMVAVRWQYPLDQIRQAATPTPPKTGDAAVFSSIVSPEDLNFAYDVIFDGPERYKPMWFPDLVFDDGKRTFVKVNNMARSPVRPVIFGATRRVANDQQEQVNEVLNYRITGRFYVIDGVYFALLIVAGEGVNERVYVERR